jgi:hypothetical protein
MWQKLALAAAACIPIIGCASGGTNTSQSAQEPAPAVATLTGQSSLFGAAASDYALVSVNGHRLPYAPEVAGDAALGPTEVLGGTLTLQPNGVFSMSTTRRDTKPAGQRSFDSKSSGACAPDGEAYRMFWDGGGDTQLAISGDTVTVNNGGTIFRYLKR